MSVIAKMNVSSARLFGDGNCMLALSCVYDEGLSNANNEDVRFTKASPYGNADLTVENGPDIPARGSCVYLLFNQIDDIPNFDKCMFALPVRCSSKTDFGYTKQAEIEGARYQDECPVPENKRVAARVPHFSLKMGIDNPAAHIQFAPTETYWMSVYDGTKYSLDEVLLIARG